METAIVSMVGKLSLEDVQRLMRDPSADARADAAEKIAGEFGSQTLSDRERALAEDIFGLLAKDAEERVRVTLAENLKQAPGLPRDLAMALARDISDRVAVPMIQLSDALSEEDLLEIVRTQPESRQTAVAGRQDVSESVSEAIVDRGSEAAISRLVSNEGAHISDDTLDRVVDEYGDRETIQDPLVHRRTLPVRVTEKLVAKVADHLKGYLVSHHDLPVETATDLIMLSREKATLSFVGGSSEKDLEALVSQLRDNGRLTPSIILRALCLGDMAFFEAAIAALADIPTKNARILIHDEGLLGFKSLFEKAGLPKQLFPAFRTAVDLVRGKEEESTDEEPETKMRRLLERVLTENEEIVDEFGSDNVEYLLGKFNRISDQSAA